MRIYAFSPHINSAYTLTVSYNTGTLIKFRHKTALVS